MYTWKYLANKMMHLSARAVWVMFLSKQLKLWDERRRKKGRRGEGEEGEKMQEEEKGGRRRIIPK